MKMSKLMNTLSNKNKIDAPRQNWINHLERTSDETMPTQILQYKPKGQ
jgi:hypothetical protein